LKLSAFFQKDVPIVSEWVATLDGYVNAQIEPQVAGYVIRQRKRRFVLSVKGRFFFKLIPPVPSVADQAKATARHNLKHNLAKQKWM